MFLIFKNGEIKNPGVKSARVLVFNAFSEIISLCVARTSIYPNAKKFWGSAVKYGHFLLSFLLVLF